jgi:hypothetical protein
MDVHLSIKAKLVIAASVGKQLKFAMEEFNRACNTLSELAFQRDLHRKYDIHHQGYRLIRQETSLPSQHVINAIAKVSAVYTRASDKWHRFKPHSSLRYDAKSMTLRPDCHTVSLVVCPKGRITGRLQMSARMRKQLQQGEPGSGAKSVAQRQDLVARGRYYCEYPREEVNRPGAVRSSEKKRQVRNLKPQAPSTARPRA